MPLTGSAADLEALRARWNALMQFYGVDAAEAELAFADLVKRYGEDGRYYHTLQHIQNTLETLDDLRPLAHNFPAIELAAWFHDAIYDPHAADNEEQSAIYAEKVLRRLNVPETTIAHVQRLIRATTHAYPRPEEIDCQILLDADLATFASDWSVQEEIEKAIRQEYAFVPEDVYRDGRRRILQQFLQRERIYYTEPMFAAREERARRNIVRSIAKLDDSPA